MIKTSEELPSCSSASIKVINISNTNTHGEVVINDELLLRQIRRFPFIYNPFSQAYRDRDYAEWAWQRIVESFNQCYAIDDTIRVGYIYYTVSELQQRWHNLIPIVIGLSKTLEITRIPQPLRELVVNISVVLRYQQTLVSYKQPQLSSTQSLVLENIDWVAHLPLAQRQRLEMEMMEMLLDAELKSKGTVCLTPEIERCIEQEYEDFLCAIRLKELFVLNCTNVGCVDCEVDNQKQDDMLVLSDKSSCSTLSDDEVAEQKLLPPTRVREKTSLMSTMPAPSSSSLRYQRLVRPCVVRIKRLNLNKYFDDVPLAKLARIIKKK